MSYWDAVAIKWKAFCPCFLALLIASGQKGESSKGQLGPWSQKIWAVKMSGLSSQRCASLGCLSPPFSPLFEYSCSEVDSGTPQD